MKEADIELFQETVLTYYQVYGRHDLPWRMPEADGSFDPYKIVVSELMLQQTQVSRVIPKFQDFIAQFPTFQALAASPLHDVLMAWSGLGYNRRAKFLWQTAQVVVSQYGGILPIASKELVALPGIGPNTAGAVLAYALNQPVVFIETNIRTVFIHHFHNNKQVVSDVMLAPLIQETLPKTQVREWYWALMDYGTYFKQSAGNAARFSSTYTKQSPFLGSRRQIRGAILKALTGKAHSLQDLTALIADERLPAVLTDLIKEDFIEYIEPTYRLRA